MAGGLRLVDLTDGVIDLTMILLTQTMLCPRGFLYPLYRLAAAGMRAWAPPRRE